MENTNQKKGILFTAAGAIGWGISGICSQYLFTSYQTDSGWLTAVRMLFSGLLLLSLAFSREGGRLFSILRDSSERRQLIAFAILGLLLCQYSFLGAIKYSNSATATVLQSLSVVLMAIVVAAKTRSPLKGRQITAIAFAILGTYLIATHGRPMEMALSLPGLVLGLLSAVGGVVYTLLSRTIVQKRGNLIVTGWGMLLGGTVMTVLVRAWQIPDNLDFTALFTIFVIVVVGTAGAFSLFLQGVRYLSPVRATLIACLEPATATVLSLFCFHTRFGIAELAGFSLILITVFLSVMTPAKDS